MRTYCNIIVIVELHGYPPLVGQWVQCAAERDEGAEKDDRLVLHAICSDNAFVVVLCYFQRDACGVGVGEGVFVLHTHFAGTRIGFKQTRLLLVFRVIIDGKHKAPQVALLEGICA